MAVQTPRPRTPKNRPRNPSIDSVNVPSETAQGRVSDPSRIAKTPWFEFSEANVSNLQESLPWSRDCLVRRNFAVSLQDS